MVNVSALTNSNAELDDLINEPREGLDVEVKEWLDLNDHDHRAMLAKEIIALANHGGGYIVIGFEELLDGTFKPAQPRPATLEAWSQDAVQSIVAKYIDPAIQCRVLPRTSSGSGESHPLIIVPGGHRVPVRAKAGAPDGKKLVPHRIYIRRPGPASEEPKTAEEWDRFFERCLQNRQAELLDAMRSIMAGVIPTAAPATPTRLDQLSAFKAQAIARWEARTAPLPQGAPPRFSHGYYDLVLAIDGEFGRTSLTALRDVISSSVRNHSGWPPFLTLRRPPFEPTPADGAVECWIGPDTDGSYDKPSHHDFWRVSPDGLLFTRRGYQEDGGFEGMEAGKFLDITTPTWRLGEAVMEACYIARALNAAEASLICHGRWTGLAGRRLASYGNPRRMMFGDYSSTQENYEATETVLLSALPSALPELVFAILSPLYELFDFFQLPKRLVEEELALLLRQRF